MDCSVNISEEIKRDMSNLVFTLETMIELYV